jgi:hypothetical protein
MSELVEKYNRISYDTVSNNEMVRDYDNDLCDKMTNIKTIMVNESIFEKLLHPVLLVKDKIELYRLKKISDELDRIKRDNVLLYCCEDTGDIEEDLSNAAKIFKVRKTMEFIENNPIYENKVLIKKR